jgi:hypothetical protein
MTREWDKPDYYIGPSIPDSTITTIKNAIYAYGFIENMARRVQLGEAAEEFLQLTIRALDWPPRVMKNSPACCRALAML